MHGANLFWKGTEEEEEEDRMDPFRSSPSDRGGVFGEERRDSFMLSILLGQRRWPHLGVDFARWCEVHDYGWG